MKKIIICLLMLVLGISQISCSTTSRRNFDEGAEDQIMVMAPSLPLVEETPLLKQESEPKPAVIKMVTIDKTITTEVTIVEENYILSDDPEPIIEETVEVWFYDAIPLNRDEQKLLWDACEEFAVPYALALGLIETETVFKNITGDNGNSFGYMQIYQRFHWDRMERLGVTDLMDPGGNFRVGLDFLSELYGKYGDWGIALTAYNLGYNPGYLTKYAYAVLSNYADWQLVVDDYE